ncbi:MAG: type I polyketide synthase, partial [Moorea sp. SIO2I5]|nr:type I polyketide synthase [Moorena sp. SIO2I5]
MSKNSTSVQQRLLKAIEQAEAKITQFKQEKSEPIAIIGMGCRFPFGVDSPESYWQLLHQGIDAISEVPPTRWNVDEYYDSNPEAPGKMYSRYGGFLQQPIDRFDSQFFGISPREATKLDPQQRLLLEVATEAIENAGLSADQLRGTQTGVFLGLSSHDYEYLSFRASEDSIDAYTGLGNAHSIAAGRISYIFDWHGPTFQLDTSCSSSLVALHLACQSLRTKECDSALVGGVNLILSPIPTIFFCKTGALAADGRCKTFDAAADGYVRGEGCALVVLKRLSDALASGDNILALVKGSAIDHDGASSGLTVPNKQAQRLLIRQALKNARVNPTDISYIEAHGTGTNLGDPIEVETLGEIFGLRSQPLIIGSVKTNIGHLEAAAGVAGLIKVVLALQHQEIPPHLHFHNPNPQINWENLPVKVPVEHLPWLRGEKPRRAGVSAFGFSGTNAHVVLEEAPHSQEIPSSITTERPVHILTLSAKTEVALSQLVTRMRNYLNPDQELGIADVCYTANTGRSHFNHRLAIVASSSAELETKLGNSYVSFQSRTIKPLVTFLFTGQGSQYIGMGRELYETQPTFRKILEQCDAILHLYLEKSLLTVLYPEKDEGLLDETVYTQTTLFALEYALAMLWKSWGIEPDAVMGHSVGEYVAACIAGVFSLEEGLKLIAARGKLMNSLPPTGKMLAVMASESVINSAIAPYPEIAIAAINGPESVVISGDREAIDALSQILTAQKIKNKPLQVSRAFHSSSIEPILQEFRVVASEVNYSPPLIPLISNVNGSEVKEITPEYWVSHARQTVMFARGIQTLHREGYEVFLEVGPKPILLGMGQLCLPENVGVWLPSLRPGKPEWQQMLESLGHLYLQGVPVDWQGFDRDYSRRKVLLPNYPFQRQRYWLELDSSAGLAAQVSKQQTIHPLLGRKLYLAGTKEIRFESQISQTSPAYIQYHRVFQQTILPGASFLEMILAAGKIVFKTSNLALEDVVIQQPLIFPSEAAKTLQVVLTPINKFTASFQIFSLAGEQDKLEPTSILHISGKILAEWENAANVETDVDINVLKKQFSETISVEQFYQGGQKVGIEVYPPLRCIQQMWRGKDSALGQIQLPERWMSETEHYQFNPVLLDCCIQSGEASNLEVVQEGAYLPFSIDRFRLYRSPGNSCWCHSIKCEESNQKNIKVNLRLLTPDGKLIATLDGLQYKQAHPQALAEEGQESLTDWLYEVEWRPQVGFGKQLPSDYLLSPIEIELKLRPKISELVAENNLEKYVELIPKLEAISIEYVLQALLKMGYQLQSGKVLSQSDFSAVVEPHRRLLGRLLEMLVEAGICQPVKDVKDQWSVIQTPAPVNPEGRVKELLSQYPSAT